MEGMSSCPDLKMWEVGEVWRQAASTSFPHVGRYEKDTKELRRKQENLGLYHVKELVFEQWGQEIASLSWGRGSCEGWGAIDKFSWHKCSFKAPANSEIESNHLIANISAGLDFFSVFFVRVCLCGLSVYVTKSEKLTTFK